jgi:hypothetical protein
MKGVYLMNKLFLSVAFFAFLAMTIPAQAQTADETAPAETPAVVEAPAAEPPTPVVTAPSLPSISVSTENPTSKIMREGTPLRVRQEQAFDADGNNRLEPDEIRAFFKSVYQDTTSGPVKNTSDILYPFDRNKDGYIDRSEASGFSQYSL